MGAGDELLRKENALHLPPVGEEGARFRAWSWSPDGKRLAGVVTGGGRGLSDRAAIYSFDEGTYSLLEGPMEEASGFPGGRFRDGRHLLVLAGADRYVVDTETGEWKEIKGDLPVRTLPIPGHDDRTLFFVVESDEADIWLATFE